MAENKYFLQKILYSTNHQRSQAGGFYMFVPLDMADQNAF